VRLLPRLGLGEGNLELDRQRPAQREAAAGEGARQFHRAAPADDDARALVPQVDERGGALGGRERGEERLERERRVAHHARVELRLLERREHRLELGLLHHADHERGALVVGARRLGVVDRVGEIEGQLALDLGPEGGVDLLLVDEGEREGVRRQRGAGQGGDDGVGAQGALGVERLQAGLEALEALALRGHGGLRVRLHGEAAEGGLEHHGLHGVAAQVEPKNAGHGYSFLQETRRPRPSSRRTTVVMVRLTSPASPVT
jgi:hypothetical protein